MTSLPIDIDSGDRLPTPPPNEAPDVYELLGVLESGTPVTPPAPDTPLLDFTPPLSHVGEYPSLPPHSLNLNEVSSSDEGPLAMSDDEQGSQEEVSDDYYPTPLPIRPDHECLCSCYECYASRVSECYDFPRCTCNEAGPDPDYQDEHPDDCTCEGCYDPMTWIPDDGCTCTRCLEAFDPEAEAEDETMDESSEEDADDEA